MFYTITAPILAVVYTLFACPRILAAPTTNNQTTDIALSPRGVGTAGVLALITPALSNAIQNALGGPVPAGCAELPNGPCFAASGKTAGGLPWTFTTVGGGSYVFLQDDANVAKCLINLHYTQNDNCISVAGSSCEAVAGTSKIINTRVSYWGDDNQISSDNSLATQSAVDGIVGSTISAGANDQMSNLGNIPEGGNPGFWSGAPGSETMAIYLQFGGGKPC